MDLASCASGTTMTAARVAKLLGLGDVHATWLAKLDGACPSASMPAPRAGEVSALFARLGVAPEDAAEVLRTMPSGEHDAEMWWLLERSHLILARGLASRGSNPESFPPLPATLMLFPVHVILVSVEAIRRRHQELGIPDDVSWGTLSYLGRAMTAYRKVHGQAGIHLTRWDWLRFFGWLYEVGRLEVTPYWLRTHPAEAGPLFWYDDEAAGRLGPGFRKGDPALGIHVPASGQLMPDACDESLRRIPAAFAKVFPGEQLRAATCTSWLLDDQLAEYLPADSNILFFQRRFILVPGARDNDEAILGSVFGAGRPKELEALPQRTTLEQAVVRHLRLGRHWRMRTGWLELAK